MPTTIFQKTDLGRAEIVQRSERVPAAMRSVLIMVNGIDTIEELTARGLLRVRDHLHGLLVMGLIEPVPPPAPSPPSPEPPAPLDLLAMLSRQAQTRLAPHFGPDTASVVQPLRDARTVVAFNAALDEIQARLAVYLGRKLAAVEMQGLRPPK